MRSNLLHALILIYISISRINWDLHLPKLMFQWIIPKTSLGSKFCRRFLRNCVPLLCVPILTRHFLGTIKSLLGTYPLVLQCLVALIRMIFYIMFLPVWVAPRNLGKLFRTIAHRRTWNLVLNPRLI